MNVTQNINANSMTLNTGNEYRQSNQYKYK